MFSNDRTRSGQTYLKALTANTIGNIQPSPCLRVTALLDLTFTDFGLSAISITMHDHRNFPKPSLLIFYEAFCDFMSFVQSTHHAFFRAPIRLTKRH